MEPATITYQPLSGGAEAALTSPEFAAQLLAAGRPEIAARFAGDCIVFTCLTADLILNARIAAMLERLLGEQWRTHVRRC